jgi:hypothetical protein
LAATNLDSTKAILNGTVNGYGLSTTVTFEYGTTTDYGNIVTAIQSPVTGYNVTNVSADISGLAPRNTYHYRVKVENSKWINYYGPDATFITLPGDTNITFITNGVTKVETLAATNVCHNRATLNGAVYADPSFTLTFEYYNSTGHENYVAPSQSPITGNKLTYVSADIQGGLNGETTYHFRLIAYKLLAEGAISVIGNDMEFIAKGLTVTTLPVTNITDSSAVLVGHIAGDGDIEDVTERGFRLGNRGGMWYVVDTSGTGTGNFQGNLTGLHPGSGFFVQAYAVNSSGRIYGNSVSFKNSE